MDPEEPDFSDIDAAIFTTPPTLELVDHDADPETPPVLRLIYGGGEGF